MSSSGGLGGDPTGVTSIADDDYVIGAKVWPFTATFDTYLACGIQLYTNKGDTISLLGTFYQDARYCGQPVIYSATSGTMVSGLNTESGGIAGLKTMSTCSTALCQECGIGKYKNLVGSAVCTSCQAQSTTVTTANDASTACRCEVGYQTLNNVCESCTPGKYKSASDTVCVACPSGTSSSTEANTGVTSCFCLAGTIGPAGGPCSPSASGCYSRDGVSCQACPSNSNAPQSSTSLYSCECNSGYIGPNGGPCTGTTTFLTYLFTLVLTC